MMIVSIDGEKASDKIQKPYAKNTHLIILEPNKGYL
jgi:hypothetical protein